MNDIIVMNIIWLVVGIAAVWYIDKRAYNEGFLDAIHLHHEGRLTYDSYLDEEGIEMLNIEVKPYEK